MRSHERVMRIHVQAPGSELLELRLGWCQIGLGTLAFALDPLRAILALAVPFGLLRGKFLEVGPLDQALDWRRLRELLLAAVAGRPTSPGGLFPLGRCACVPHA